MFKNYVITALRSIFRDKGFSFINIIGFAIGIASTVLILLWVQDEVSFDSYHLKKDRIHRVLMDYPTGDGKIPIGVTSAGLAPLLEETYPEIEKGTRLGRMASYPFLKENKKYRESGGGLADSNFFSVFTFKFIEGEPNHCLDDPNSIVLTEKLANKYFGDSRAVGKTIEIYEIGIFKVTAVIEDVTHSHFAFNYLIPFEWIQELENINPNELGTANYSTYILAKENVDADFLEQKVKPFLINYAEEQDENEETNVTLFLQPLKDVYLKSDFSYDFTKRGDIKNVYTFSAIALIILLIASINFMNLTTARSANRAKEIGVRKVQGASKRSLITQFYFESAITTLISFMLALFIIEMIMPVFNNLSGKELSQNVLKDPYLIVVYVMLALITSLIAGSYPAMYLSSFKPVKVLKGKVSSGSKSSGFRKILVIAQFSISIALIVSTIVVNKQLNFIRSKKLGYEKENLILLYLRGETRSRYDFMKSELLKHTQIAGVSGASAPLIYEGYSTTVNEWEGNTGEQSLLMHFNNVDYDFMETMKIQMLEGRSFTKDFIGDSASSFILNETAVRKMGLKNPLGVSMNLGGTQGRIVGVCKDFNYNTIHQKIEPMTLLLNQGAVGLMYIRIKPGNNKQTLAHIKKTWKNIEPYHPFNYHFVDQQLDKLYRSEQRVGQLFKYFTILAILISCLGLFGLTSFMTEQRKKEIGIRKVMGSKVSQLVVLLTKEFTRWVLIAGLIGLPAGYILMNKWLQSFHYRTEPGMLSFFVSITIALLIAAFTVGIQTYRASIRNPVNTLRDE